MTCEFSYDHYFETVPKFNNGSLFLRHDIDYSFEKAYDLALREHAHGIVATYMVQLHSPFYNPLTQDNIRKLKEIAIYHDLGLHYDTRCTPTENHIYAEMEYLEGQIGCKIKNVAQHDWVMRQKRIYIVGDLMRMSHHYISDSAMKWREGCFCQHTDRWKKIQVLIHPEYWSVQPKKLGGILAGFLTADMARLNEQYNNLHSHLKKYHVEREAELHQKVKEGKTRL